MWKPLSVWITANCGKFLKQWVYKITLPASWETCMQVKKQQSELDMEQRTGSNVKKEYIKAVYCQTCLFNSYAEYNMQSTGLHEVLSGIKIAGRNINNLRYAEDTTLGRKLTELWASWWRWKRRVKKMA